MDAFDPGIDPQMLATTFLSILESAVEDPAAGLATVVPDPEYKSAFLKLTRNLAPTGKIFSQLEIKAAGDARRVLIVPDVRKVISQTLRDEMPMTKQFSPVVVKGILRAVHLNKDWLEVQQGGDDKPVRINDVGETLDDVIGPMMNRAVTVQTGKDAHGKLHFRDIELDD